MHRGNKHSFSLFTVVSGRFLGHTHHMHHAFTELLHTDDILITGTLSWFVKQQLKIRQNPSRTQFCTLQLRRLFIFWDNVFVSHQHQTSILPNTLTSSPSHYLLLPFALILYNLKSRQQTCVIDSRPLSSGDEVT